MMGKWDEIINPLIISGAVIIDVYLEIHGKPVPTTIGVLVGYYLRHIMGGNGKPPEIKI